MYACVFVVGDDVWLRDVVVRSLLAIGVVDEDVGGDGTCILGIGSGLHAF
jgi:hypothetical protein